MSSVSYQLSEDLSDEVSSIIEPYLSAITESIETNQPLVQFQSIKDLIEDHQSHVVLAIGKNAAAQAKAISEILENKNVKFYVHQIHGYSSITPDQDNNWDMFELPHPLPTVETFQKTKQTIDELNRIKNDQFLHVLISGGGSAAFALPEREISGEEYIEIVSRAVSSGFNINELNYVRSLIDQVKGGKLLKLLNYDKIYTWITSDVISDDPKIIASGPTNPGISSNNRIEQWVDMILNNLEITVKQTQLKENLIKSEEFYLENQKKFSSHLITSRNDLLKILETKLNNMGITTMIADSSLKGSVEEAVNQMAILLERFNRTTKRVIIWSGEPTITVTSEAITKGQGGRISSLCCLVAEEIKEYPNVLFLGIATDGVDGSSPSSGYVVTPTTAAHLRPLGGARLLIRKGNSGLALTSLGYGIDLSITNVNLLDLYLLLIL